jgi:nucleotide-binding universal stress UspA family protein
MGKRVDMERRRRVWDEKARNPNLTGDEIAARLGLPERTVRRDIKAAELAVNEMAADCVRAAIVERNGQIIAAHLPLALAGKTRNAEIVFAAHKELRELFGVDEPVRREVTVEVRERARQLADEFGLSVDDVLAEADLILRAARPGAG